MSGLSAAERLRRYEIMGPLWENLDAAGKGKGIDSL